MNINNVKRTDKRLVSPYWSNLNIQAYGRDNLYPQRMLDLLRCSTTGGTCCDRYETFIEGDGLFDKDFSEYVCNRRGETVDDLYRLIAQDMANFHGFALHVNYNMMCEIVEVSHVPFQQCRLEEETEDGKVINIVVHPDWTGKKTRKGKTILVNRENAKRVFVFNPRKSVVMAQIEKCGGIENYRGQILWFSMDGKFVYPIPIYDKAVTNLSIDEGLDNVKYRNVRNNFLLAGMLIHKKGNTIGLDDDGNPIEFNENDNPISKTLDIFQGDENACAIMDVTVQQDEDEPVFKSFEAQNFDKKFETTENSVIQRIYTSFGQEPWYRIIDGKLGFSSDILTDAYEYYNSYVSRERRAISRELKKVFDHWHEVANNSGNYEIEPLKFISTTQK